MCRINHKNHRTVCAAVSFCHENQWDGPVPRAGVVQVWKASGGAALQMLSVELGSSSCPGAVAADLVAVRLCSCGLHWYPCTGAWDLILTTIPVSHPKFWSATKLKKSPSAKRALLPKLEVIFLCPSPVKDLAGCSSPWARSCYIRILHKMFHRKRKSKLQQPVLLVYWHYFSHIISWIIDLQGAWGTCTDLATEFWGKAARKTCIVGACSDEYFLQSDTSLVYYLAQLGLFILLYCL